MSKEDDSQPSKRIEVHLDLEGNKNAPPRAAKIVIYKDKETIRQLTHRTAQHFFRFILRYAVGSDDASGIRKLILRYTDGSIDTFGEPVPVVFAGAPSSTEAQLCPTSIELLLVSGGEVETVNQPYLSVLTDIFLP